MEHVLKQKELAGYSTFEKRYQSSLPDIVAGITERHTLSLFAYDVVSDIPPVGELFSNLERYYPAILAVCRRPYTHLKTTQEVVRIDKVKKIGYEAISYLASHPADWQQKKVTGLKPARLLSITKEIDYGVYENKVTKKLIDTIISVLRQVCDSLGEANQKLRASEVRLQPESVFGFDKNYHKALRDMLGEQLLNENEDYLGKVMAYQAWGAKLLKQYRFLRSQTLYRRSGDTKNISLHIHKTNLFSFHKKYNAVFKLYGCIKEFMQRDINNESEVSPQKMENFSQSYWHFCYATVLYTLTKMGFQRNGIAWRRQDDITAEVALREPEQQIAITFRNVAPCSIDAPDRWNKIGKEDKTFWQEGNRLFFAYNVTQRQIAALARANQNIPQNNNLQGQINAAIHAYKQQHQPFTLLLVPYSQVLPEGKQTASKEIASILTPAGTDFKLVALPLSGIAQWQLAQYGSAESREACLPLSLFDINSYRRLQKIFLQVLIRWYMDKNCPLCGSTLRTTENTSECVNCGLLVTKTRCAHGHDYIYLHHLKNENYKPICPNCGEKMEKDGDALYCPVHTIGCGKHFSWPQGHRSSDDDAICPDCGVKLERDKNTWYCPKKTIGCGLRIIPKAQEDASPSLVFIDYKKDPNCVLVSDACVSQWLNEDSRFGYIDIVPLEIKSDSRRIIPVCPHCEGVLE